MAQVRPQRFKETIYRQLARVGRAMASPRRLELLDLLAQAPQAVERLARKTGQSVANTSQHLQRLRRARLVEAEKHGLYVTYRLPDERVAQFYRAFRMLAEARLVEIEQLTRDFLAARGALEGVNRESLVERVRRGEVTLLDVRPVEEYQAGHILGAVSLPLRELEHRLADLPRDREIVAYCRGPYCVLAVEAVTRLRARGFTALRLQDGIPDWRARGLPVAVGTESDGPTP